MPIVHTRYVTWTSRRRRHHGAAAADIISPLNTTVPEGNPYSAWAAPEASWNDNAGQHTADFAFWSVTGAAGGAFISTNPILSAQVGNTDVNATAWFIPVGPGTNGPGLYIDAFDVVAGNFVDDYFVDVTSDPMLTIPANEDGFVPTTSAEIVDAYLNLPEGPFTDWTVVLGTENVNGQHLNVAQSTSVAVAFAFYKATVSAPTHPRFDPGYYAAGTWVSWGVMVDGGGPTGRGPVPPWTPYIKDLAAGLALADNAALVSKERREPVLELAAQQVHEAAASIAKAMRQKVTAAAVAKQVTQHSKNKQLVKK